MPNWVSIKLNVKAQTPEELQSFLADLDVRNDETQECAEDFNSFEFNFNALIPQPENLYRKNISSKDQERLAKEGIPNWYDWNIDNWDTKWNACDAHVEEDGDNIRIIFNSAWSPPYKVFVAIVRQHPELSFQFLCDIEGVDFAVSCSLYGTSFNAYIHPLQYVCAETDEPITWDEENNRFVTEEGKEVDDWFSYVDWDNYQDVELIAEIYEEDITEA